MPAPSLPTSTSDARRTLPLPGGELRLVPCAQAVLDELGLLDPRTWGPGLPGREIQAAEGRRVHRVGTTLGRLFLKHEVLERRALARLVPRRWTSSAAATERATERLRSVEVRTARILLAGEQVQGSRHESLLVTSELAGRTLNAAELGQSPELVPALARLVEQLGAAGIEVPDLYGKHLTFDAGLTPCLGLLDLDRVRVNTRPQAELLVRHLGGLVATLPGLDAARILELLAREDPGRLARIERRADAIRRRKKMPHGYGARSRYADPAEVRSYQGRRSSRHQAEAELLASVLPAELHGRILDAPCGAGRFSEYLGQRGARPLALDISPAMVATAAHAAHGALVGELERLPLVDDAVEGVLCFRFLHHVPTAAERQRILAELTRVSRSFLVLSFFHPVSAHNLLRQARRWLGGSRSARHAQTPARLGAELARLGWEVRAVRAQARWRRDLWVLRAEPRAPTAVVEREGTSAPEAPPTVRASHGDPVVES